MYQLSDEVISQVAKLVQVAIITGTDVIDNLRMIRVEPSDLENGRLSLTPEYRADAETQIERLLSVANLMSESESDEEEQPQEQ